MDENEIEKAFVVFEESSGLSKDEFKAILKDVDTNGDGKINYKEFLAATTPLSKILTKEKLAGIFKQFDSDGDGQISPENIKTAFSKFGA